MNPHQKNKVDISSLSPEEQRVFRLYGKLPSKSDNFKHLKERKYFDSGDYALSKAGKASSVDTGGVGTEHPLPENIPHLSSPGVSSPIQGGSGNGNALHAGVGIAHPHPYGQPGVQSGSPVKESSFLNRETSVDEQDKEKAAEAGLKDESVSPPPVNQGIPING